ncbi:filamentous hemagglutinin N-terminal domain-containing protein, partial [Selenomonas bovis]
MKKERALRKERLALQVGIALTAGVFGAVPVAEGAPVVDKVVTAGTQVAQSGNVTDVTGTQANNIVKWQDFSVGKGETVRFDDGAKERNYLNLVTGPKESEIAGKVEGGKDVYLVNPHGVIFSHGAQVDVGNLYVSTENTE